MTLKELLITYIKDYYLTCNSRYVAVDLYKTLLKNFIKPLKNERVEKITSFEIQRRYNELLDSGWKSTTLYIFDSHLRKIFDFALNKSIISRTPFDIIPRPTLQKETSGNKFTFETVELVVKNMKKCRFGRVFLFLLMTGMTVSEAISLRISDVDLEKKTISITKERPARGKKDNPFIDAYFPREIVIPKLVHNIIEEELDDMYERKKKPRSIFRNKYGLLFTHLNGLPLTMQILRNDWNNLFDELGLERTNINNFTRLVFAKLLSQDDKYDRAIIHYLGLKSTTQYYQVYKYITP